MVLEIPGKLFGQDDVRETPVTAYGAGEGVSGTYAGDGNDDRQITGLGFKPSFVLILSYESTSKVLLFFTFTPGTTYEYDTDDTNTVIRSGASGSVSSFDDDGFTVNHVALGGCNASGEDYSFFASAT